MKVPRGKSKANKADSAVARLSHRIALRTNVTQETYFKQACGTARFTWNWALAEWTRQYESGLRPNANSLKKSFNVLKYEQFPWLADIHRDAHAEPFANLSKAWSKFFKDVREGRKAHAPRFKKKGISRDSFYVANDKFSIEGKIIKLPIVGKVKLTEPLRFDGKVLGATVSRSADRWFVSVQVEIPLEKALRKRTGDGIEGVDLGITAAATLSTGEKIPSPRPLKAALRRLKIRTRRLSRKLEAAKLAAGILPGQRTPKGTKLPVSNNRKKDALCLQKLHYRIANIRKDFLHKLSNRLCRENQALGLENLNVQGMLKNERLARAISDIGFGELGRQVTYKSVLYDTRIKEADRWFPSSKMCSVCEFVYSDLKLSDRTWICPNCGTTHDRDHNAATNLKRLATVTALPVASTPVMGCTSDSPMAVYGGEVTPVSYDACLQEASGREEKAAVSISNDHICAPF